MQSNNFILGHNAQPPEEAIGTPVHAAAQVRTPTWKYHKECPQGRLIKTDAELDAIEAAGGWVDWPKMLNDDYVKPEVKPIETPAPTPEMLEDAKKADALKAESDKLARLTEAQDYHCKECGREFSGEQALRMHVLSHRRKDAAAPPAEEPTV